MIELKKVYKNEEYLGSIVIYEEDLTPEFIEELKKDKDDKKGWKKYKKVLNDAGYTV